MHESIQNGINEIIKQFGNNQAKILDLFKEKLKERLEIETRKNKGFVSMVTIFVTIIYFDKENKKVLMVNIFFISFIKP